MGSATRFSLERFGEVLEARVRSVMPDPFIFAIILTIAAILIDIVLLRPFEYVGWRGTVEFLVYSAWYGGFWRLLTFSMQMTLILVTGYVIAYHPLVYRVLSRIASLPKDTKQAAALAAFVAIVLSYISWGLSLIGGAILAREIGRQAALRGIRIHYPVVVAAAYTGLGLTWHWGLTASAPLLMNTPGNFLADTMRELYGRETVPLSETIFNPYTIVNLIIVSAAAIAIYWLIAPREGRLRGIEEFDPQALRETGGSGRGGEARRPETLADRLENSRTLALIVVALGAIAILIELSSQGISRALNLNTMNFIFLMTGLLLYANPIRYAKAFYESVRGAAGVILQFHFYAGIFGLFNTVFEPVGKSSAQIIAEAIADLSNPLIWPVTAFIIAGFVNLFIPSGGGEWAAIGEILVRAGFELGVPVGKTIIAYGFGDSWTNLLQPFWAIPLLDITRTRARDVFGYTIALMILIFPVAAVTLTLVPYIT